MRMMKVQFGDDNGCFVAVVAVSDVASEAYIIEKARKAVMRDFGLGLDDMDCCGVPKITDEIEVTYSVVKE